MTLYLLPNLLGPLKDHSLFLPASVGMAVAQLDGLIAESEGEGRRFLKRFATKKKPHEMPIALLTKRKEDLDFLLEPLVKGESWGVVSDCGLPCLADPGAYLVRKAYHLNIRVEAFAGPCSITHALMLSGLSGQSFIFHGYISKEPRERISQIRQWEKFKGMTHIFIEAPYRNFHTFQSILTTLPQNSQFCVAACLTLPEQWMLTAPIAIWKEKNQEEVRKKIHKKPTIFLFSA